MWRFAGLAVAVLGCPADGPCFVAGVLLVWSVDPKALTVDVYTEGDAVAHLTDAGTLSGEAVRPGFAMAVAELLG